jgi:hypothetical protein
MRSLLLCLSLLPALLGAATPPPAAPAKKGSGKSEWVFSILPKSLQKNPRLDLTVISEVTEAGKKLPPVSPQAPAYFELYTSGPRHQGDTAGNHHTLKQEDVARILTRSLAANGYLPANLPQQPPSQLIIYTWGSHAALTEGDAENPALSAQQIARNLLDRAALVGGDKFALKLLELFERADAMNTAGRAPVPPEGQPVFTQEMMDFANPVSVFKRADPKNEYLVDQAASDVYYVVASAYDYKSVSSSRRVLLWRTRMTVSAAGVSQEQTLPTLIATATPYFGKDMAEPAILNPRAVREGAVEVGTPTVVEPGVSPARK